MAKKLTSEQGKEFNGMLPDRWEPSTKKQGVLKSLKETVAELKKK